MHVFAQIFFFRTGGDAFSQKIERSVSIFFSDSFVVYSCSCHVLLAEAPLSELILRFIISCYTAVSAKVVPQKRKSVRDNADWYYE